MEKHIYQIGGVTVTTTFTNDLDEDFPEWLASTGVRGGVVGFAVQRLVPGWMCRIVFGKPDLRLPIGLIMMAIGSHCLVAKIGIHRSSNAGCVHTLDSGFRRFLKNPGFTFCGISVGNLAEVGSSFNASGRRVCLNLDVAAAEQPGCANLVQSLLNVEVDLSVRGENWNRFTDAQMEQLTMKAFFSAAIGEVLMA